MSVLTTQHHIPWADLVPQKWIFCLKFESYFDRNDMVPKIRGSNMLLEGSSNFKSHYTSNEGCETLKQQWMSVLTTQHHIPRLIWCPQIGSLA